MNLYKNKFVITFADIKLGVKHTAEEYAVEKFTEKEEKKAASAEVTDTEI